LTAHHVEAAPIQHRQPDSQNVYVTRKANPNIFEGTDIYLFIEEAALLRCRSFHFIVSERETGTHEKSAAAI
jgi:hypothetical protein